MKPLVSIIITNRNGEKFLARCLNSVFTTNYENFEVIFVDSNSDDGSVEYVKNTFSNKGRLRIIASKRDLGWSGANNEGARVAEGEILAILSNDTEVDPNWLSEGIAIIMRHNVAQIQCKTISIFNRTSLDSGMNYVDRFGFLYGYVPTDVPQEVFFAEGMAMLIKKEVFDEVGGLDSDFYMMYDDVDLSWRVRLAGYRVFLCPSSIVYHVRGGTVQDKVLFTAKSRIVFTNTRNHILTLLKNYSLMNIVRNIPPLIFLQFGKAFYVYVVTRRSDLLKSNLMATISTIGSLGTIRKKRKAIQKNLRKVSDKELQKVMVPFQPKLLRKIAASKEREDWIVNEIPPLIKEDDPL